MGAIKVAIIGCPSTGKTAIINFLTKRYTVFKEAAREILIHDPIFKGKTVTRAQSLEFQRAIWQMQTKQFKKSKKRCATAP